MVQVDLSVCNLLFVDIEATVKERKIQEVGIVYKDQELRTSSLAEIKQFIQKCETGFIVGHNFAEFDYTLFGETSLSKIIKEFAIIDTLLLSLLLFSEKTVHALPKNYKTEDKFKNNPVEDSKKTRELFEKAEKKFLLLEKDMQNIFFSLLKDQRGFDGFFKYIQITNSLRYLEKNKLYLTILKQYKNRFLDHRLLSKIIESNPVELAYILALHSDAIEVKSHPPKILYDFPEIVDIQKTLFYDLKKVDSELSAFSKEVFGFGEFREYPRLNQTLFQKSLSQRDIIMAELKGDSFLAVLPTGGGKTFTFWLPAIIKAKTYKSLTVVISPLQALIEDHIKSFNKNVANYKAVAISGFLTPLERHEAIENVINGEADILYLAPESLRSNAIFNILKNRYIERFVIDEAHCLSTWGNDFRQDYYYICEYIKDLLKQKPFQKHIPVSCFTATAKPNVIKDIKRYFSEGLDLALDEYIAIPQRENLVYKSLPKSSKNKYRELLNLVNSHNGSTLIYIPSSTASCDEVAGKLSLDTDKRVKSFHSKIDSQEKMKILKEYITDEVDVIVATTAFGMGVDKPNITQVIHYEMSDSLENYAQEAGRGARDKSLNALCPILYDEDDLDKHFASLNRSKITADEINSIFRALKKQKGDVVYKSVFELAKEAGWDVEDASYDYATKVKTALLELEREGYIERKRNKVRFFADSIASDSIEKLEKSLKNAQYSEEDENRLRLIHQTIIGKGKESLVQVDELAYLLGYERAVIAQDIERLKEMEILGNSRDLTLEIKKSAVSEFEKIVKIELMLFAFLSEHLSDRVSIKELHEFVIVTLNMEKNISAVIKEILKNWRDKKLFSFTRIDREKDLWIFKLYDKELKQREIQNRHSISKTILEFFTAQIEKGKKVQKIETSLKDLRELTGRKFSAKEIDKTLLYLHYLNILKLLNGRFISYTPMQIQKSEKFKQKRKYTKAEYKKRLEKHYILKVESIHIMGEYAKRLQQDNAKAIQFMRDYFTFPYDEFKKKYKLLKKKITRPITERRYEKIFAQMSPVQQEIIADKESKAMMILAGPGSGKTKVLVHKIASLLLTEDIKPEQFMMLTFSRTASREFKSRLNALIGSLSFDIEINTFHAYALNRIARVTHSEKDEVLKDAIIEATRQIRNGDIRLAHKTVLVLDEYQDISSDSFNLVKAIYESSDKEMRIIAVGDDDQCINTHAGADISFIEKFKSEFGKDEDGTDHFKQYELLTNYRSKKSIVKYTNNFISTVSSRYKTEPLKAHSDKDGKVEIYTYKSKNLITPTVELVKNIDKTTSLAVLAYTNDEVMQIYSRLQEVGIHAKFIIDRDKFYLKNIVEIVEFDKRLSTYLHGKLSYNEDDFEKALKDIETRFKESKNFPLLKKVVDKFLYESDNYYVSQWLGYLDEIKLEEFEEKSHNITISTIHKSKGLEFDNVVLIVNKNPENDNEKRLYYVGMTRAKNKLAIVRHGNQAIEGEDYANYIFDKKEYIYDGKIQTFIMGLDDVYLGYDYQKYYGNFDLTAGSSVKIAKDKLGELCLKYQGKMISKFSKKFSNKLSEYRGSHYKAEIEYVVVWFDRKNEKYIRHPLCKIMISE